MSLVERLGYSVTPQSGARRLFSEVATNPAVSAMVERTAMPLDRLVLRLSGGRATATSIVAGFPVLWLTTTGARSGAPRQVPLLGIPTPRSNLAVLGTNFGGARTPGWVHNLESRPQAIAEWRGRSEHVEAVSLSPDEQQPIWDRAVAAYPNYANYRSKAEHREIRVFELVPSTP